MRQSIHRRTLVWLADEGVVEDPAGMVTTLIAEAMDTNPSYAGMVLKRLEEQELIERRHNSVSGRTFRVQLTPKGRAAISREGHHDSVQKRAALPVLVPMPQPGPMTRLRFDPEQARHRAGDAA